MRSILLSRVDRRKKNLLKNYFMRGFAPADEVLLFRQKDPKPFPPVRGPAGSSASAPNKMARELAPLKQPSPRSRFGAAAPPRTKARRHPRNKPNFLTEDGESQPYKNSILMPDPNSDPNSKHTWCLRGRVIFPLALSNNRQCLKDFPVQIAVPI